MDVVVVVDDAPGLLNWLVDQIRREFPLARVCTATNGTEALSTITDQRPDLVILDLALPADSADDTASPKIGLAVLDCVKCLNDPPRVIVLSSFDLQDECLRRGADGFVSKGTEGVWAALRELLRLQSDPDAVAHSAEQAGTGKAEGR